MDILVVADTYPFPLQNGHALRIYHYVRLLRKRHNFDLLCFGEQSPPDEIRPLFRNIIWLSRPHTAPRNKRLILRIKEALSVDNMLTSSPEMNTYIRSALHNGSYDLIWGAGEAAMQNIPIDRDKPLLGDLVDDGVLANIREAQRASSITTALRKLKWAYLNARFERRYYGKCEHCLVVSEVDASWFRRICPDTAISVINNGVDEVYFKPMNERKDEMNIVFEGNLAFGPNNDGIIFFCNAILPLIRAQLPNINLTIVGKDPTPEVQSLASRAIEVTGYVEDIRPYIDRAALFICPLRKGAGIKNKILQAWSMAKAVVATPHSVGGLQARDGENIIIRDAPEDFSSAVVDLINNPGKRAVIGEAARETIHKHYTWAKKAMELESLMTSVATEFKPPNSL